MTPFLTHFWPIFGPFFDPFLTHLGGHMREFGSKRGPKMDPILGPKMVQKRVIFRGPRTIPRYKCIRMGSPRGPKWPFLDPFLTPFLGVLAGPAQMAQPAQYRSNNPQYAHLNW